MSYRARSAACEKEWEGVQFSRRGLQVAEEWQVAR